MFHSLEVRVKMKVRKKSAKSNNIKLTASVREEREKVTGRETDEVSSEGQKTK